MSLHLAFNDDGTPRPLILVGGNGSGKTSLISLIVDALFEAAAVHFDDVLPYQGTKRSWFRLVGGRITSVGAEGCVSLLRFDDEGVDRFYREKAGNLSADGVRARMPSEFAPVINWPEAGGIKEFNLPDERSREIFQSGAYAYFPSSRSEAPYWLNQGTVAPVEFDVALRLSKTMRKPIYVEKALSNFKQWLIGLLSDCRTEIHSVDSDQGQSWVFSGDPRPAQNSSAILEVCNSILKAIFNDDTLRFIWMGRNHTDKVAIASRNRLFLPNLDALSTGQAILLGMFGTLIQYGDGTYQGSIPNVSDIQGICVIDEVDAHLHIDLQHKILPKLMRIFPRIQFILTSHSPLFVLGMEREFGSEGIQVIDMPSGIPVGAETYAEFGVALEALAASHAFTERVVEEASKVAKPIVYVEGETDEPYLKKAAEVLGKTDILMRCDIEWIGAKDKNGQGFHTGADAFKHTLSVLKANPGLANRKILLLHDNDSTSKESEYGNVYVRILPRNDDNTIVKAGIENFLPEKHIANFYQTTSKAKQNGDVIETKTIRKTDLCSFMCSNGTVEDFQGFNAALAVIEDFLEVACPPPKSTPEDVPAGS